MTITLLGGPNGAVTIVPGNVVRNRNQLQADKVPGLILLDADEVKDSRAFQNPPGGGQQRRMAPQLMKMTPEIYAVLDVRVPQNTNVGEDLNTIRMSVLNVIFTDSQLWDIVGANGNITYDGCVTDLARNRTMKGQLGISVTFGYPLKIEEFSAG